MNHPLNCDCEKCYQGPHLPVKPDLTPPGPHLVQDECGNWIQPSKKTPVIETFIERLTNKNRIDTITNHECMTCETPNVNFRNELSRKEYGISGMCQDCQDKVFGID